ncbi:MAG: SulP family inorganic anion transporter, partial [Alphaproteobacteria bacterium]|nr:SulP family inorganic anion transporter [Alphaproteobacteria bacterium]
LHLKVATLGSAFGDMPRFLPAPSWPDFPLDRIGDLLGPALAFALLGAVESLLCATVADGMSGRRHSSNGELVAQGFANMLTPIFGGFCVTGTIARTATNVRAGAQTPVAGIVHAVIILLIMLIAAPYAEYIPIASLAGVLAVAAWGMIDRHAVISLCRAAPREALVVAVTLALTLFRDLTDAMIGGFALCAILFIHRMAEVTAHPLKAKMKDAGGLAAAHHHAGDSSVPERQNRHIVTYHMPPGAFFFGTSALLGTVLEQIADRAENIVIDLTDTSYIDATGAQSLLGLAQRTRKRGGTVTLIAVSPGVRTMLEHSGLKPPLVNYGGSEQVSKTRN